MGSWLATVALLVLHTAAAVTRIVPADLCLGQPPPRPKHLFHGLGLRHVARSLVDRGVTEGPRCAPGRSENRGFAHKLCSTLVVGNDALNQTRGAPCSRR